MGKAWQQNLNEQEISIGSIYAFKRFAVTLVFNLNKGNYKYGAYEERLRSIALPSIFWDPDTTPILEAKCLTSLSTRKCTGPPQTYCSCGIYSMKSPYAWFGSGISLPSHVTTIVEISGKVIEGTLGYRSQKAVLKTILWDFKWPQNWSSRTLMKHKEDRGREVARKLSSLYDIPILWHWDETATAEELFNVSGRAHAAS